MGAWLGSIRSCAALTGQQRIARRLAPQVVSVSVDLFIHFLLRRHDTSRPSSALLRVECIAIASDAGTSGCINRFPIPREFFTLGGVYHLTVACAVSALGGAVCRAIPVRYTRSKAHATQFLPLI
jgi:hypothetical protein